MMPKSPFVMASSSVMAGLDPAIHVFGNHTGVKTWIPGTSPGMTVVGGMTWRIGSRLYSAATTASASNCRAAGPISPFVQCGRQTET